MLLVIRMDSNGGSPAVKVISLNLRTASALGDADQHWEKRKDFVCQWIKEQKPTFLGCQEATDQQLLDLKIGTGLPYVGQTRDPLDMGTEANPVFWDPDQWQLMTTETHWLCGTANRPGSKMEDSSLPRIWTAADFWREEGGWVTFASTHWDHLSTPARHLSGLLLSDPDKISWQREEDAPPETPAILLGDFNETPLDRGRTELVKRGWRCIWQAAGMGSAPPSTFHGFTGEEMGSIDGIYITHHWQVLKVEVPEVKTPEGLWLSDHHPIIAWLQLDEKV